MAERLLFAEASKRYGSRNALESLNLSVEAGEIYGFLGPNGAGKTTALHIALGFLRPSAGGGSLLGQPFGSTKTRARLGFVPDAPVFFAGTALDALGLAGTLNGVSASVVKERGRVLLDRLDLPARTTDVRKFSRGMQQRLGIAQALINRPELLILDEPTSALDPPGVLAVRELLLHARGEGTAIFFSSHQLTEVEHLCDRIGFLREGRLLRTGTLHEMLAETAVAEITVRGIGRDSLFAREHAQVLTPAGGVRDELTLEVAAALQRQVIERAWAAGGELVGVQRKRQSLEDLFTTSDSARSFSDSRSSLADQPNAAAAASEFEKQARERDRS